MTCHGFDLVYTNYDIPVSAHVIEQSNLESFYFKGIHQVNQNYNLDKTHLNRNFELAHQVIMKSWQPGSLDIK